MIQGLSGLQDGAARALTPLDLIENVVVKVDERFPVIPALDSCGKEK